MAEIYDAVLVLSFGGPERREDVIPFLENVLRGRNVPRDRMLEVAEHYYHFDGRSPINQQNRELIAALRAEFDAHGITLPIYWGNRNWQPYLAGALRQMQSDGVRRAIAFVTSAFSSYSGCRQYLEDIDRARAEAGRDAPEIDKLRSFFNHPGFIECMTARAGDALAQAPDAKLVFTAHSVPLSMASGSPYVEQLREACDLVAAAAGRTDWTLAYQSRSGPPSQPWLEPDILEVIRGLPANGVRQAVLVPIGFISDHMEVLYDLDTEARQVAEDAGVRVVRAATAGSHPRFIRMIRELVEERIEGRPPATTGRLPAAPDRCPPDCCPPPRRPASDRIDLNSAPPRP